MHPVSCCRAAATLAVVTFLMSLAAARPQQQQEQHQLLLSRVRRSGISDQRLAELETLIALARLKGRTKAITKPIAFGVIDPDKIGRRRKRHNISYEDLLTILSALQQEINSVEESEEHMTATSPLVSQGGGAQHHTSPSRPLERYFRPSRSPDRPEWAETA